MKLIVDMVPNHMATDCSNEWWLDVLQHGRASKYAAWFDIDWDSDDPDLKGKVLLPILEDQPAKLIRDGKIRLVQGNDQFWIEHYDRRFPLSPSSRRALRHETPLEEILEAQHYRLAFWRDASERLNYRRFFDVTELVCMRMELPEAFNAAHKLVFSLIQSGRVAGLRIDHPDGLWNPKHYFTRLQEGAKLSGPKQPLYVVAEKILSGDERLPEDWPVEGTTGYDFLNRLNGLFVDSRSEGAFDELYSNFAEGAEDFFHSVRHGKRKILTTSLKPELNRLSRQFLALAEGHDFTFEAIRDALREVIVNFPVYRTYITEKTVIPTEPERDSINRAIAETLATHHEIDGELLRLIRSILLLTHSKAKATAHRDFIMRFQQLTGPVMAKGLEDTAFYNYNRLISLNEVGGDPGTFGISVAKFHAHNGHIAADWPHTLLATATHDTKRGEDARARINVLSEFPSEWKTALERWSHVNAANKTKVEGGHAPSANDEYLFYQTLIGVWPGSFGSRELAHLKERLVAYMLKAAKEAKTHTSWLDPNREYEAALQKFVSSTLDPNQSSKFLTDFTACHRKIAFFGYLNSLSQVLLKLTAPGVPDFYQGCELWDFSLVDPDNRRPVDFKLRKGLLRELESKMPFDAEALRELLAEPDTGAVKMYVIWRTLRFRSSHGDLFRGGNYVPIEVRGQNHDHVVAFERKYKSESAIIVAPRLIAGLMRGQERLPLGESAWADTVLSLNFEMRGTHFKSLFTGEAVSAEGNELRLSDILNTFPIALVTPETAS